VKKVTTSYSPYVHYVGDFPYQFEQFKGVYSEVGGDFHLLEGQFNIAGVVLCASQPVLPPLPNYTRIYTAHGTSNKIMKVYWEDPDMFDYFWMTGPKLKRILERHLWGITDAKEVKIGMLRWDDYINGKFDYEYARKLMGAPEGKPICMFAPTFKKQSIENYIEILKPLSEKYHFVLRSHPLEKVEMDGPGGEWFTMNNDPLHRVLFAVDLLISDESSVAYEFTITGKPILMLHGFKTQSFNDDPMFDLTKQTALFDPRFQTLDEKVKEAVDKVVNVQLLCKNAFYFNDGKANERAVAWVKEQAMKFIRGNN